MRHIVYIIIAATLFTACEKNHLPKEALFNIAIYDLKGKKINDVYSGSTIKIVDEQLRAINKQVDLRQNGAIIFDKIEVPVLEAADNYIITAVPVMEYIDPRHLSINLRYFPHLIRLCTGCIIYGPTVTGNIVAGFSKGASDGTFQMPAEMALDAAENIYVIDQRVDHDVVLKVTPAGTTTVFAGAGNEFGRLVGIGIDNARNLLYVSDATAGQVFAVNVTTPSIITVLAGSGIVGNADGTGPEASFRFNSSRVDDAGTSERGQGLTLDEHGNIYVGEQYGTSTNNSDIRKITPAGLVTTMPGSITIPMGEGEIAIPAGLTITASGEIYFVHGSSTLFQGVSKLSGGVVTRFAGKISHEGFIDGTGTTAEFACPKAIQQKGEYFYVADAVNGALRRVSATGTVITLAGVGRNHTNRYSGGGFLPPTEGSYHMPLLITSPDTYKIAASAIRMDQPGGIAIPREGNIYLSDHGYKCIWKITIR
jgi:hypothetical protein